MLLEGPTGAGKELFAQALHEASARASKAFVAVNCSAFPSDLLEVGAVWLQERGLHGGADRQERPAGRSQRRHAVSG
ncbi:MAG: sigma 54-interacting transcriptional regulator [Hymenobacter sp.]